MKDGIVWSAPDGAIHKKAGEKFLKRHVLPADPNATLELNEVENREGKKVKRWQIKAIAILGSKPVVIKKSQK